MTSRTDSLDLSSGVDVEEMTKDQGRALLAPRVADELQLSLAEFFENVDGGVYDDTTDDRVLKLVMLVPFAR